MINYRVYLCGGPESPSRIPNPECPRSADHEPEPAGYMAWHEWADAKAKTHRQCRCPGCGLWVLWVER